jgi:hypothetical protein
LKKIKVMLVYFLILFFTSWLQLIALALLFPWGGGEFHTLFQLSEIAEMKHFIARIYGSYLLVGMCASFILSFLKRNGSPLVIGIISSIVPLAKWQMVFFNVPEDSFRLYIILLAQIIPAIIVAAAFLGRKARGLISLLWSR